MSVGLPPLLARKVISRLALAQKREQTLAGFDEAMRQEPNMRLAGVDEVGMGTLAGPVVAAAVILRRKGSFVGVDDSKKVAAKKRIALAEKICRLARTSLGIASVSEIDYLGIGQAGRLAMRRAIDGLLTEADLVLVDARVLPHLPVAQRAIVGGDRQSLCIAAASIVAKVARDAMMIELDKDYPGYGFARHKGYGTALHLEALAALGPTPHHRRSFAPVARSLLASAKAST